MSITVIIEANVKDFDKWLALFNELEDLRQEIDGRLGGVVALCDGMFGHSKVSIDYLKDSHSAIIDEKWIDVNKNLLRMHIWHDNEYGYCRRVYESISQIF